MLVSWRPTGPHRLQLPLVGRHVSPYPCCTCLSFGYVGFLLHVGPWIHVRLKGALWLVDAICLGLRSVFPCSWSVFSPLIHLHTNIYQHSWKWSVINPYHYVDAHILCIYAGVDGLDLILKSRQQWTYLPLSLRDRKLSLCCNTATTKMWWFSVVGESGPDPWTRIRSKWLLESDSIVLQACVLGLPLQGWKFDSESSVSRRIWDCLIPLLYRVRSGTMIISNMVGWN
jgi:hypothetical protein